MTQKFEMSMMGELNYFLGFQVKQLKDGTSCIHVFYAFDHVTSCIYVICCLFMVLKLCKGSPDLTSPCVNDAHI
jgi:hypothetical protein